MHYYYYCENYYYSCGNYFGYGYDFYVEGYQIDTTSTSRATRPTPQHNTHTTQPKHKREKHKEARSAEAKHAWEPRVRSNHTRETNPGSSENHGAWGGQRKQRKRKSEGRLARRSEARVRTASAARQTKDRRSARSAREGARVGTTWATTHTSTRRNETLRDKGDARGRASKLPRGESVVRRRGSQRNNSRRARERGAIRARCPAHLGWATWTTRDSRGEHEYGDKKGESGTRTLSLGPSSAGKPPARTRDSADKPSGPR